MTSLGTESSYPRPPHSLNDSLVASRDECCGNDDMLVATYRSHALGNICLYGSVSGSRGVARCSRARSCLVAIRDGRCDNDDATFECIMFSYIGILCGIYDMRAFWQPWCRSWFESPQFAWSRFATGAATMMTRHPRALRSHTLGFYAEYVIWKRSGRRGVARGSRGRSFLGRASRRGRCDNDDATFDNFRSYILRDV